MSAGSVGATRSNGVCAIVITHHPDANFPSRLAQIAPQVGAIVIVDNGSADGALSMLRELALDPAVTLVVNRGNFGIARALNIGVERAATAGFGTAVLFDQDSAANADQVAVLISVRGSMPNPERIAVVGCGFDGRQPPARAPRAALPRGDTWEEVESVITSGSLLSIGAYADIGLFRDEFFIDYVDIEFCLRARARGYRVIKTRQALMAHAIGAPTRHRTLWTTKWTTNHCADRRYYIARNDTVLLREYGRYPGSGWLLKSLQRRLRTCKRILLYESQKIDKLIAVCSGWWDGVHNRMGPRRRDPAEV